MMIITMIPFTHYTAFFSFNLVKLFFFSSCHCLISYVIGSSDNSLIHHVQIDQLNTHEQSKISRIVAIIIYHSLFCHAIKMTIIHLLFINWFALYWPKCLVFINSRRWRRKFGIFCGWKRQKSIQKQHKYHLMSVNYEASLESNDFSISYQFVCLHCWNARFTRRCTVHTKFFLQKYRHVEANLFFGMTKKQQHIVFDRLCGNTLFVNVERLTHGAANK